MIDEHLVVVIDSSGVEQQFLEVANVLLDHLGDFFELGKFVPVMVLKHAFGADELVTNATEVLDLLILVLEAEDTGHVSDLRLGRLGRVHHYL